jgi:hypothetical protein
MPRALPITLLRRFLGCGNSFNRSLEAKKIRTKALQVLFFFKKKKKTSRDMYQRNPGQDSQGVGL